MGAVPSCGVTNCSSLNITERRALSNWSWVSAKPRLTLHRPVCRPMLLTLDQSDDHIHRLEWLLAQLQFPADWITWLDDGIDRADEMREQRERSGPKSAAV
ncbi:hypothetical protein MHYP_G00107150 [Metynnis hypsauchen]